MLFIFTLNSILENLIKVITNNGVILSSKVAVYHSNYPVH